MNEMFCSQCQETARGAGCTSQGVCGKKSRTSNLQDTLIYALKGLSLVNKRLREKKKASREADIMVMNGLFMTITNTNFDDDRIEDAIRAALRLRNSLLQEANCICNPCRISHLDALTWNGESVTDFERKSILVGILSTENEDIRALRQLLILGVKGMAAYAEHAYNLGYVDEQLFSFMQTALASTLSESQSADELIALVLGCGEMGVKAMRLLDRANTETYGNPEVTTVPLKPRNKPAILISGHDLKDLEMLLKQTENEDVDVYTHGEMLPAHYYPYFKKYAHLIGNYGGSWYRQLQDFEAFNGPILFTTNCLVPPRSESSYTGRIFTTGAVGYPGCKHIVSNNYGLKDFSEIIEMAKSCSPPKVLETGSITGGFAHNQVLMMADKIVSAVREGKIRKFVVMAGCDGRMRSRDYYTEFAQALPKDTVILTAGCAKYRYIKLNLGEIDGIPRVLDAGQCNDSYSLVLTAMKLRDLFGLKNINDLPISYNIAWYEQKAVLVLLALLSLGVRNINLGPTLPGFLSPKVTELLVDKFNLGTISQVQLDLKKMVS